MRTDVKYKKQGGMYDWKGKMDSDQDNQVSVLLNAQNGWILKKCLLVL